MEKTMLQQVMTAPGEIRFDRVPVPQAGPGQVLVRIKRIGICGSDIHVYHGKHPYTSYPVTQGHEVSGRIAALGEGVEGLTVGQRVTIEPQVFCGKCYPCTHGKYNLCESLKVMGFQTTGTASGYFAADQSKIPPLPEGMSYDEGAMIEPLAVTVHAARRAGDVRGLRVCVLGCGPIGILLIQSLKALGAEKVLATDVSDWGWQSSAGRTRLSTPETSISARPCWTPSAPTRRTLSTTARATTSPWIRPSRTPGRAA